MKEPEQRRTTAGSQEREQLAGRGQEHRQVAWESDGDGKRRCGEGEDKVDPRDTCWMEEAEERRADPPGVRQRYPYLYAHVIVKNYKIHCLHTAGP
jgi:hypothetical protein